MDTNGVSSHSDADVSECDGEKVVTMMDVLQEQQDFEDDANAVLGASDEKNCTYTKGYVKRQAIYACLTCCSEAKFDITKRAGVCLACSLTCHENHELVELYTKRNFRCDCGNPKFNTTCQFTASKPDMNEENIYNQNFSGLYCICHRPYPDPEAVEEDEMIQCIICEDWLHSAHLETIVPPIEQYAEMICKACMEKNEFLHDYSDFAVNAPNTAEDILVGNSEPSIVNVTTITNETDIFNDTEEMSKETHDGNSMIKDNEDVETVSTINNIDFKDKSVETQDSDEQTNESSKHIAAMDTNVDETNCSSENISEESNLELKDAAADNLEQVTLTNQLETDNKIVEDEASETSDQNETAIQATDSIIEVNEESQGNTNNGISVNGGTDEIEENATSESLNKKESDEIVEKTITSSDTTEVLEEPSVENSAGNDTQSMKEDTTNFNNESIHDKNTLSNSLEESDIAANSNKNHKENINDNNDSNNENKRKLEEIEVDIASKKAKMDETGGKEGCHRPKHERKSFKGASFWPSNFRQKLCTCNECISMYKDLSVLFLIDPEDTVSAYEMLGQQKTSGTPATQYEKGLEALSSLDRVQQINALTEYNNMRDKLLDFLKSFKDRKEIVKEEDIKEFFAGMKPKREPDGVYFCR